MLRTNLSCCLGLFDIYALCIMITTGWWRHQFLCYFEYFHDICMRLYTSILILINNISTSFFGEKKNSYTQFKIAGQLLNWTSYQGGCRLVTEPTLKRGSWVCALRYTRVDFVHDWLSGFEQNSESATLALKPKFISLQEMFPSHRNTPIHGMSSTVAVIEQLDATENNCAYLYSSIPSFREQTTGDSTV